MRRFLTSTPAPQTTPAEHRHLRANPIRRRIKIVAAASAVAIGGLAGSGFALQSAYAAQDAGLAATASLSQAGAIEKAQLTAHSYVLEARAEQAAKTTLTDATTVLAAGQGKADVTALTASVAALGGYSLLVPEKVFALVDRTRTDAATVQSATAEFDRVAAEQAAAQAAAEAEAARQAAEEAAASPSAPSTGSRPAAPTNPTENQAIARDLMLSMYGWGDDQFGCLVPLWSAESGWNANSYNASTGAGGIPQALPASKMASAGADWQTNAATQIRWGLGYIAGRYGTPCGAWDHFQSSHWY